MIDDPKTDGRNPVERADQAMRIRAKLRIGTQMEHRRGIDIGSDLTQVSPAMYLYQTGYFKNGDEARGAFRLAYQQAMDGMGATMHEWMGLTKEQLEAWMRDDTLPPRK